MTISHQRVEGYLEEANLRLAEVERLLNDGWYTPTPEELADLESEMTKLAVELDRLQQKVRDLARQQP